MIYFTVIIYHINAYNSIVHIPIFIYLFYEYWHHLNIRKKRLVAIIATMSFFSKFHNVLFN
ncbi:hypothetical protein IT82_05315 [Listeria monocytogenes]|nr:hypothetical protein [Listeria monocytogenes]EAC8637015.1 hypothetical protein [Listeria monocytogenes]EAD8855265.1 hypothetical protein [Listeria monocytogenes]